MSVRTVNGTDLFSRLSYLFAFAVTKSFDTDLETIGPVHLLGDGSLAFNGNKKGQEKLKCYKFDTGTEISCADLPDVPWGCCLVELGGRPSLALSFG